MYKRKKYITTAVDLRAWKLNSFYFTLHSIVKLVLKHAGFSGNVSRTKCYLTELRNILTQFKHNNT